MIIILPGTRRRNTPKWRKSSLDPRGYDRDEHFLPQCEAWRGSVRHSVKAWEPSPGRSRAHCKKPLMVKLFPPMCLISLRSGGGKRGRRRLIADQYTAGRWIDINTRRPIIRNNTGGFPARPCFRSRSAWFGRRPVRSKFPWWVWEESPPGGTRWR